MSRVTYTISAERLKDLRESAFLTQQELADKAHVSLARIKQIEQGVASTVRPRTIRDLAGALGVAPEALVVPDGRMSA